MGKRARRRSVRRVDMRRPKWLPVLPGMAGDEIQLVIEQADDGTPSLSRLPGLPIPTGDMPVRSPGRDADEVSRTGEGVARCGSIELTRSSSTQTLAVLLPLLILLSTLLFLVLLFILFLILVRKKRSIVLTDESGPLDLQDEDQIEGEGGLGGIEERWLEQVDPPTRLGYERAKLWQQQYPPNSDPTDITLSQFLTIQEKGISAWSFEPDYESNSAVFVQGRTEISFLADGTGMSGDEGGGCCVQSNLPIPKVNETYYFECKLYEKPETTSVAIGLATKPYPTFRLPGWNKYSIAYFSADGFKSHSYPFTGQSYGPPLLEGDVLGVGYRPRTGTVFFTRNGKKLEDAYTGLTKYNLFPTIGATGACEVHVNLGQAGFVFIEANVKKWGLAPAMGTLAPPPAYGSERGSILLASAAVGVPSTSRTQRTSTPQNRQRRSHRSSRPDSSRAYATVQPPSPTTAAGAVSSLSNLPANPSPLRHSRHISTFSASSSRGGRSSRTNSSDAESDDQDRNPPTPGLLDISLQSIHRFPQTQHDVGSDDEDIEDNEDVPLTDSGRTRSRRRRERTSDSREADSENEGSEGSDAEGRSITRSASSHDSVRTSTPPGSPWGGGSVAVRGQIVEPPAYNPVDPYMYAPGVVEALLEDSVGRIGSPGASSVPSDGRYEAHTTTDSNQTGSSWWQWLSRSSSRAGSTSAQSDRSRRSPQLSGQAQARPTLPTRPPSY